MRTHVPTGLCAAVFTWMSACDPPPSHVVVHPPDTVDASSHAVERLTDASVHLIAVPRAEDAMLTRCRGQWGPRNRGVFAALQYPLALHVTSLWLWDLTAGTCGGISGLTSSDRHTDAEVQADCQGYLARERSRTQGMTRVWWETPQPCSDPPEGRSMQAELTRNRNAAAVDRALRSRMPTVEQCFAGVCADAGTEAASFEAVVAFSVDGALVPGGTVCTPARPEVCRCIERALQGAISPRGRRYDTRVNFQLRGCAL